MWGSDRMISFNDFSSGGMDISLNEKIQVKTCVSADELFHVMDEGRGSIFFKQYSDPTRVMWIRR